MTNGVTKHELVNEFMDNICGMQHLEFILVSDIRQIETRLIYMNYVTLTRYIIFAKLKTSLHELHLMHHTCTSIMYHTGLEYDVSLHHTAILNSMYQLEIESQHSQNLFLISFKLKGK